MKTAPTLLLIAATCAASGFAGYYYGQNKGADAASASTASAKHAAVSSGKTSAGGNNSISLAALLKGPGVPDADTLNAWAKNLSAKDCVDLVKQLQSAKGGIVRDTVLEAVLKSWGNSDPKGLLGSLDQLKSPRLRESGVDAALKTLGTQDAPGALKWLKDNPGTASASATQARFNAVITGIAANDPKGAFDVVSALGEGNDHDRQNKSDALHSLTDALAESGHLSDAQQLLGTLPPGVTRDEAFDHFAESLATQSPEEATAWATAVTDPAERARLEGRVVDAWAKSDPMAAATWAAQTDQEAFANADPNAPKDPTNGPGMLLASAIVSWAENDLDGPGQFLNQLPDSPNKDRAVAVFAMHAGEEDPESAAKWIGTVTDPKIRDGVTMVVAMQMYQQDPAMFTNFMSTNDKMDATQKQQLQQIVPMMSLSMSALKTMSGKGGNPMSNIMEGVLTGKSSPMMNAIRARAGTGGVNGNPFAPRGGAPANPAGTGQ